MTNDSYEHIGGRLIVEFVVMCDVINVIKYDVDITGNSYAILHTESYAILHTEAQICCCETDGSLLDNATQTCTVDDIPQSCYCAKWSHNENGTIVVNFKLRKQGICKLFSPLNDRSLQQLFEQMMPNILGPINEFIGGLMILDALKNFNVDEAYPCSPLTNSKGFTEIMYLLITLDCKKYPKLINDYIVQHNKHINLKNDKSWTALHIVCRNAENYNISTIKCILDNGAKINVQTYGNWTPLKMIAQFSKKDDNIDAAKLLLDYGAGVHFKNEFGWTALMSALECSNLGIARLLLDYGADIDSASVTNYTPLMIAAKIAKEQSDISWLKLLLERDAKINVKTTYGLTALSTIISEDGSHAEALSLLLKYGADPTEEKIWNWIDEEAEQIISYCSNADLKIVESYQMKECTRKLLNGELRRIK